MTGSKWFFSSLTLALLQAIVVTSITAFFDCISLTTSILRNTWRWKVHHFFCRGQHGACGA
eukprot:CAMPEP_0169301496 /NCGR_PEP_ID=MMETSP1016-20121227/68289_1 /TAXON_ID=342587 /ORGANISM="Karlodinium micrum, Strain CCMP2283" /LENGTH=60 /DNA_ID=CAMNT_0009394127 /DNA_START=156 /DNA_END=334 /DNA_ORIENTATION=+